jgi:hypothetical protein
LKILLGDSWKQTLDSYKDVADNAFLANEPAIYSNYFTKYLKSKYHGDRIILELLRMS